MAQYIYGQLISTGERISILDVPIRKEERGPWACVCPECGIELIPRRGEVKEPHFAHKPDSAEGAGTGYGCSVAHANETSLHEMAKKIIAEEKRIALPKKEYFSHELNLGLPEEIRKQLPESYLVQPEDVLDCEEVRLEDRIADFQPDVVAVSAGRTYFVEIWKTHRKGPKELEKFARYGRYPVLEIDLHTFFDDPISTEDLRNLITSQTCFREWRYYPNEEQLKKEARKYFEGFDIVRKYRSEQTKKEQRERVARERREYLFQPENYAATLQSLTRQGVDAFRDFFFYKETKEAPFFVNIPIKGEFIFKCDRHIWQGAIFDHFLYHRNAEKTSLYLTNVVKWVVKYQKVFKVDFSMLYGSDLLSDVVFEYLQWLARIGFLSEFNERFQCFYIEARHTTKPPDEECAEMTQAILRDFSGMNYAMDAGELIVKELSCRIAEQVKKEAARLRELEEKRQRELEQERQRKQEEEQRRRAELAKDPIWVYCRTEKSFSKVRMKRAVNFFINMGCVSWQALSEEMYLNYDEATTLIRKMETLGFVTPTADGELKVLSREKWADIEAKYFES